MEILLILLGIVFGWVGRGFYNSPDYHNPYDSEIKPIINVDDIKCHSSIPKTQNDSQK